jgi:hypothetical protein
MTREESLKKILKGDLWLRRSLKLEPHNRVKRWVYIEAEILEALEPRDDINSLVNLLLMAYIIERHYNTARSAEPGESYTGGARQAELMRMASRDVLPDIQRADGRPISE